MGKSFRVIFYNPIPDKNTRRTSVIKIYELKLTAGYMFLQG
jgi:hypothetical protein